MTSTRRLLAATALTLAAAAFCGALYMPRLQSDPPPSGFAANRATPFDGERAIGYLKEICKIGPRVSGTEGMKRQQALIEKHFVKLGAKVERQTFDAKQNSRPAAISMTNLVITWHPERERRILLCCHYDTRPHADQEPDRNKWTEPFVSANDGGSGVAWLMELGNHVKQLPMTVGVDFVIFDGEEYVFDGQQRGDKYFFGSDHFAAQYARSHPKYHYVAGALLDMVAGKNARFPYEQNSLFQAGAVIRDIWTIAQELEVKSFVPLYGPTVDDDHIALNRVGIPTVDIIDFDYPHWHRLTDTPENCSAASMTSLARVLTTWLSRAK